MLFVAGLTILPIMATLIAGVVAVILLYSLLQMFRAANPAVLARAIKIGGGVVALAVAAFTGIRGELAVAIPLGIFGAGLLGWSPFGPSGFGNLGGIFGGGAALRGTDLHGPLAVSRHEPRSRQRRTLGPDRGRALCRPSLDEFDLPQLTAMISGFDAESVALFESYLDRRFPAWRQDAQGDAAGGQSRAPSGGKMTDEEAYQILGLQPGASRDEIGRAHRALMKKLHPDQGGSTYLAARVNQAKDTLLRTHLS